MKEELKTALTVLIVLASLYYGRGLTGSRATLAIEANNNTIINIGTEALQMTPEPPSDDMREI